MELISAIIMAAVGVGGYTVYRSVKKPSRKQLPHQDSKQVQVYVDSKQVYVLTPQESNKPKKKKPKPQINGNVISVKSMMNEYRQNSDKAKQKYEGKTIFVQGRVTYVADTWVKLEDVLNCMDFEMGSARAMHIGQKVIIRGRLNGSFLNGSRLMG